MPLVGFSDNGWPLPVQERDKLLRKVQEADSEARKKEKK